jgi:hypothetical protein
LACEDAPEVEFLLGVVARRDQSDGDNVVLRLTDEAPPEANGDKRLRGLALKQSDLQARPLLRVERLPYAAAHDVQLLQLHLSN